MTCSFCQALSATDKIVPHDILGGGIIVVAALVGMVLFPAAWIVWLVILIVAVGVTVDLSAHEWTH